MQDRRQAPRTRALLAGKILLHDRRSVIDCVVRNISETGACIQVESVVNIPPIFDLQIGAEDATRSCSAVWYSQNRLGVVFQTANDKANGSAPGLNTSAASDGRPAFEPHRPPEIVRSELLALRAALNEVSLGVVLLDGELRAQFINRAFRKMWRLTDSLAESKPAFVSLMHHGRDTRAYDIPEGELKAYVAERVALVRIGDPTPVEIRLKSGEVIRFQCTSLPNGGRMLCYTYVTDIVRHSDELEALRAALDNVHQGVLLLDGDLIVQFMNRAARQLWQIPNAQADTKPHYMELFKTARTARSYGVSAEDLDDYIATRIAAVRDGDPTPTDLRLHGDRVVRSQCALLPSGGRLLTYSDVTDLVQNAAEMHRLATTDGLTDLYNRRHFLKLADAEWQRFQRYCRPLSLLVFDIDHFKFINDRLGHDAGDRAIAHLAKIASEHTRPTDTLARLGGDEFALLLPETTLPQAAVVAERLRNQISQTRVDAAGGNMTITISVGVAEATRGTATIRALIKAADEALYHAKSRGRNRVSKAAAEAEKIAAE